MQIMAEDTTNGDQQSLENLVKVNQLKEQTFRIFCLFQDSTESSDLVDLNTRWRHFYDDDNLVGEDSDDDQDWDRIQNKRFLTLFRNRPLKSEGYKRGPGFRSWGGKRGDKLFEGGKRRPFQSWGGKRNLNDDWLAMQEKRKFSSWGGKRSQNTKKKPSFLSWGGKRGDEFAMN